MALPLTFEHAHGTLKQFVWKYAALIRYAWEMGVTVEGDLKTERQTGRRHPASERLNGPIEAEVGRLGALCETLTLLDLRAMERREQGRFAPLPPQALEPMAESLFYSHYTLTAARTVVSQYLHRHVQKPGLIEELFAQLHRWGFVTALPDSATVKERQAAVWDGFYDMLEDAARELEVFKRHHLAAVFPEYPALIRTLPPRAATRSHA